MRRPCVAAVLLAVDRNPNTGAPFGTSTEVRVARQTVYHDAERPSHVVLPVISSRK